MCRFKRQHSVMYVLRNMHSWRAWTVEIITESVNTDFRITKHQAKFYKSSNLDMVIYLAPPHGKMISCFTDSRDVVESAALVFCLIVHWDETQSDILLLWRNYRIQNSAVTDLEPQGQVDGEVMIMIQREPNKETLNLLHIT